MTGEDALPLHREDRERAIQIVGSTTRRFAKAVGLYLIFALPSLVMGITYIALEFGDLLSLDSLESGRRAGKWLQLALTVLVAGVPSFLLVWFMFRVQTNTRWRRLMVQAYFRRALKIVVGIRVVSWLFFMVIDALIVLLVVAVIAIPAQWLLEDTTVGLAPAKILIYVLLPTIVVSVHLLVWGMLMFIVCAITSGVMGQTAFPCLWCGHEQSPTVGNRCPECGIALSEAEVRRAKARGIYQPVCDAGSAANDLENSTTNA